MTERASEQIPIQAWTEMMWRTFGIGRDSAEPTSGKAGDRWNALVDRLWEANNYANLAPVDLRSLTDTFQRFWLDAMRNPGRALASYADFVARYSQLLTDTTFRLWGSSHDSKPVVEPDKADKRFCYPAWQENAIYDAIKQSYLLAATSLLKGVSESEGLDARQQRILLFYVRQFCDSLSPSNFAATNPEVLQEAVRTGGQSLVRGMQNLMRDLAAGEIKMTDRSAFKVGGNIAITPGQVVYRNKLMELIQYAPQSATVRAIPLVHIPNWINKYYIVDLQPENSLIRFMVQQGYTVFSISWKNPNASLEEITFDDYMELGPLCAFRVAGEIAGSPQVNAIGYCIGGTLLAMTLAYLTAIGEAPVNAATFFVSLLDFTEIGDTAAFVGEPQLSYVESSMRQQGYLDGKQLAAMFNALRANDLIWSNVVNNYLLGKEAPAFDLLFWNDDGTRVPRAAHEYYLRNTYLENNLIKPGRMSLKGVPIDLKCIHNDIYAVGSELDHLVPWPTAWRITQLTGGAVRFVVGGSGHIAGVINPPSKGRGYWTNERQDGSAEAWFASAEHHKGSWWPDWAEWLSKRSGELVAPPRMGSKKYRPLVPAPGTYVLEK